VKPQAASGHLRTGPVAGAPLTGMESSPELPIEWAERRIGAVNLREGYQVLRIRTPEEVLSYED
jgi:hypothetical protein